MCFFTGFVYAASGATGTRRRCAHVLSQSRVPQTSAIHLVAPRGLFVSGVETGTGHNARSTLRPGAGGLFWSMGSNYTGPTGGPCDIFRVNGPRFTSGAGHGRFEGGHLSNPSSFSFFSTTVEYGQRRTRAEQHLRTTISVHSSQNLSLPSFSNPSESRHNESSFPSNKPSPSGSVAKHVNPDPCSPVSSASSQLQSFTRSVSGSQFSPASQHLASTSSTDLSHSPTSGAAHSQRQPCAVTSDPTDLARSKSPRQEISPLSSSPSPSSSVTTPNSPQSETCCGSSSPSQTAAVQPGERSSVDVNADKHGAKATGDKGHIDRGSRAGGRVSSRTRRLVRARFERARDEEKRGNLDESRRLLCQCLALDCHDAHSWLALARLEARCGGVSLRSSSGSASPAQSEVHSDAALPGSPDSSIALDSHASSPASHFPSPKSRQDINSEMRDIDVRSLLPQSYAEMSLSGTALARALYEQGLCHCPNSVHLLQAWAVLEQRCGDSDKARSLFARGLSLEPDNAYVCQAWGLLEQRCGNKEAARGLFKTFVDLRPHPEVCSAWAILEAREGNVDKAREVFKRGLASCVSMHSAAAAALYRLWAEVEERVGDLPSARNLLSKAISANPRVAEPFVALARLEARRGNTKQAMELISTAMNLSQKPPALVFNACAQIQMSGSGQIDSAKEILKRGHEMHPSDPGLLQSLGTLEERCGNVLGAKELYAKSVRVRPSAAAFVSWALLEEAEGNYNDCVSLFEQALMTDPLHGAAYNAYGMMEARRGRLNHARAVYERGLKGYASASVWHGYGQLELKRARNPDRARELFRSGVAQSREDTSFVWHSWGMMELSLRNVREARCAFLDALKRYPRNSRVLVGAALAHAAAGPGAIPDSNAARGFFKHAVAADPSHAHAWQAWGVFELRNGQNDSAEALFKRGLRMCPNHGALWQAWGVLETNNGNFVRARKLFQRGVEYCPSHVHLLQAWACMEVRAGNIDQARSLLDDALRSDPSHGPAWNAYGLLETRHGTLEKARQNFITGIERSPGHAPLYRTYGQTEAGAGNYSKARRIFEEGLKWDPHHAPLYHAFAEFEGMIGNLDGLARLKAQAEKCFGSVADASRAMSIGEESVQVDIGDSTEDFVEYSCRTTPMELALDAGRSQQ